MNPNEPNEEQNSDIQKKAKWPYIVCILISIPQLFTQAYSSYFKLDGFNDSLSDLASVGHKNIRNLSQGLVGALVVAYVFVFISYNIFNIFKRLPASLSESHRTREEILKRKTYSEKDKWAVRFTGKRWKELSGGQIALYCVIYLVALTNTTFYVDTSYYAAKETFGKQHWCKTMQLALALAILCIIGGFLKDCTYTIPRAVKAFPHLLKVKTLYWNLGGDPKTLGKRQFKRILLGILLLLLALASIPVSLNIASYSKLPYSVALMSSILTMIMIYTVSVGNLCSDEIENIDNANTVEEKNDIAALEQAPLNKWRMAGWWIGWLICGALFLTTCFVAAVGTGFSWEKFLREKVPHASFAVLCTVLGGMALLALVGRCLYCNCGNTINNMVDSPHKLKRGIQTLFDGCSNITCCTADDNEEKNASTNSLSVVAT